MTDRNRTKRRKNDEYKIITGTYTNVLSVCPFSMLFLNNLKYFISLSITFKGRSYQIMDRLNHLELEVQVMIHFYSEADHIFDLKSFAWFQNHTHKAFREAFVFLNYWDYGRITIGDKQFIILQCKFSLWSYFLYLFCSWLIYSGSNKLIIASRESRPISTTHLSCFSPTHAWIGKIELLEKLNIQCEFHVRDLE